MLHSLQRFAARAQPPGHDMSANPLQPETPNHALQRTAPCVTAPASTAAFPPTMQVPRRTPRSLSLGSLGGIAHNSSYEAKL